MAFCNFIKKYKMTDRQDFWENIYDTKPLTNVGWYQPIPLTALELLSELNIPKTSSIIDIGGGDSFLADNLLEQGFNDISILDVSLKSLDRAKVRIGDSAKQIHWIHSDVVKYKSNNQFDCWHDRATFHFLTNTKDQDQYVRNCKHAVKNGGYLIIGTFSKQGPDKCSGIPIVQYSIEELNEKFSIFFHFIKGFNIDHITPSGTKQNYTFCCFKRKNK